MLDLDRAAPDSEPAIEVPDEIPGDDEAFETTNAIPVVAADESQTGDFHAVTPGTERTMHPSLAELTELDMRKDKP
jgi:hypothetical protein